jgi:hypothetical protein
LELLILIFTKLSNIEYRYESKKFNFLLFFLAKNLRLQQIF